MNKLSLPVLWLLVLSASLLFGGAIYEYVVLIPMWAGSLPESVTAWKFGAVQKSFFQVMTPGWALMSALTFVLSFKMPQRARLWARIAGVSGVAVLIATVAFFVPLLQKTQVTGGAGLTGDEITRAANLFINWGYLRIAVLIGAWVCAIRALTIVSKQVDPDLGANECDAVAA